MSKTAVSTIDVHANTQHEFIKTAVELLKTPFDQSKQPIKLFLAKYDQFLLAKRNEEWNKNNYDYNYNYDKENKCIKMLRQHPCRYYNDLEFQIQVLFMGRFDIQLVGVNLLKSILAKFEKSFHQYYFTLQIVYSFLADATKYQWGHLHKERSGPEVALELRKLCPDDLYSRAELNLNQTDSSEAVKEIVKRSRNGDPRALFWMGWKCEFNTKPMLKIAKFYYEQALKKGHDNANHRLGIIHTIIYKQERSMRVILS